MDREVDRWRRRRHVRREAQRRPGIGRGGREEPVAVLTRSGDRRNRPDFEGQRRRRFGLQLVAASVQAAAQALQGRGSRRAGRLGLPFMGARERGAAMPGAAAAMADGPGGPVAGPERVGSGHRLGPIRKGSFLFF
jgi:hypothetical protein